MADLNGWGLDADLAVLTQSHRDVESLLPESSMEADGKSLCLVALMPAHLWPYSEQTCCSCLLLLLARDIESLSKDLRPHPKH